MISTRASLRWLAVAAVAASVLMVAPSHAAEGIATSPSRVAATARAKLRAAIETYRGSHPEAFAAVANVKGHRPEYYQKFRNPIPMVGRELRVLGPAALLPMLEALAFRTPERRGATGREWKALKVGLLEAVGFLRDARSGPVLRAAFESAGPDEVAHAAAKALGRRCDDAAYGTLVAHLSQPKRGAAIMGLGECRRLDSAEQLTKLLDKAGEPTETAAIGHALGMLGSSWAWHAMGPEAAAEGEVVRAHVAEALIGALLAHADNARPVLARALVMVEHPSTPIRLRAERNRVGATTRKHLDRVIELIEKRLRR